MADVFISYKREDRPYAERLSIVLEQLGFEVWWDFDLLSGDPYRTVIRAVIDQCKAAVVCWSERSVLSDFVIDEAEYAKQQGKLCPIRIDTVPLPFGFGSLHTDDLSRWDGELFHTEFQNLVRAVEGRTGRKGRFGVGSIPQPEAQAAAAELESFKAAQISASESALRAFLSRHPQGAFSSFVRSQLESMAADAKDRERVEAAARGAAAVAEAPPRSPPRAKAPPPADDPPAPRPRTNGRAAKPEAVTPGPAAELESESEAHDEAVAADRPMFSPRTVAPPKKSPPWVAIAAGVGVLLVAVIVGGYFVMKGQLSDARQAERSAYAARFAGLWAPEGLSCADSSVRTTADAAQFTMTPTGGVAASETVTAVDPGGDLTSQAADGQSYVYRLSGDTLTRQSADGKTATMVRCPG
jgi:hypothetical protein